MERFTLMFIAASLAMASPARTETPANPVEVTGRIVDAATGEPLAARLYVRGSDGAWRFAVSAVPQGSALPYERKNWIDADAFERHTTLSAHPFRLSLAPGRYEITVERGKEYHPDVREIDVTPDMQPIVISLRRWIDMAGAGWTSGDLHVHRRPEHLPNVQLAEDLNVALPATDWSARIALAPTESPKSLQPVLDSEPVKVDATHVWYPRNTEYEVSLAQDVHTLGAFMVINHRTRFDTPVFPLRAISAKAHAEGALIDLEKPNWPWTVALVPLLEPDLFALSNNHVWRTKFVARDYAVPAPEWMGIEGTGMDTERGWVLYGFQTYYTLLNAGFRLNPSAGTANGVHPVPLGFSRVYVHLDEPFSYEAWMRGLGEGRSFVTTGPMLFGTVADELPGHTFPETRGAVERAVHCRVVSEQPLEVIELIANGRVHRRFEPQNRRTEAGAYESDVGGSFASDGSAWLCWRVFERRADGRFRFAHTAPWHLPVAGAPLRPRREEVAWLIECVEQEIARRDSVLTAAALAEYGEALAFYRRLAARTENPR